MCVQEQKIPDIKIPLIMDFLAKSVLDLNGCHTEGIFRVSFYFIYIFIYLLLVIIL